MANDFPMDIFVGLDITYKRVYNTNKKIISNNVKNAYVALANARQLDLIFQKSCRWSFFFLIHGPRKKRQVSNRLIEKDFLDKLYLLMKEGSFLWLKTDCPKYFSQIELAINDSLFFPSR